MAHPLRVLMIQERDDDALLVAGELARCGWDVAWERVDTREAMAKALDRSQFGLAVCDHPLPHFPASQALTLWREVGLDGPFLVVSSRVGEEEAGPILAAGVHDFFVRDRLSRFGGAVARELRAAEGRRRLRRADHDREEALQGRLRSERLLKDLFDSAPAPALMVNREGLIRAASHQAERLFGYERDELKAMTAEDLIDPSARADYGRIRAGCLASSRSPLPESSLHSLLARRKDGSAFPIEVSCRLMTGEPGVVIATIRDLTERLRVQSHLRQVQKLEWVGQAVGRFAHDINNMLGIILGQSQLMLHDLPPGQPLRGRMEKVVSATERTARLARQILDFSRKQPSQPRLLDINRVIEEARDFLSLLLEHDIELTLRLGSGLSRIKADPVALEQLLLNLALNARDAMPKGGSLDIATANAEIDEDFARAHGRHICLTLSDTGEGMTAEVQDQIFQPFFTTKEAGRGAGMGLATVDEIVRQGEGFLHVSSEPGRGTTFKIYWPCAPEPRGEPSASIGGETVLLVEDDSSFRALMGELLEASGYKVVAAKDPTEAIETAARHEGEIQLLLTDLQMPGMNGRELSLRVKERRPEIKVLYMSGYTEEAAKQIGDLDAGALLLSKPFTRESLARKVREALAGRERF